MYAGSTGFLGKRAKKVIALLLAFVMVASIAVSGLVILSRSTIDSAQASYPDRDAALRYLAEKTNYVREGLPTRIVEYVRTRAEPSALSDYYSLAGVQIAQEDFAGALFSIDQCIALYDDESTELLADLWLKKGCLHVMLGQPELAIIALDNVLEIDDTIPEVYLVLAQIFAVSDDLELLIKSLEAYLVLRPEDEEVRGLLASLLVEQEDLTGMQEYVQEYRQEEPRVEMEFLQGLYAIQEGDHESAVYHLTAALELDESYEGIRYYRGVSKLALQDYEGAAGDFSASIEYGVMVHASHYNRGIALILADEYEAGLEDIEIAAQMDEDPYIREQAEQFLEEVRKAEADANLIGFLLKAQAAAEQGDFTAMCENLELYLAETPDDIEIRTMLAQARFAGGEYAEALRQYGMILIDERSAENLFLYAITALQLSDFSRAEEAITEAISLDDQIEGLYYYRGVCRLSLDNYKAAEEDFTKSLAREEFVHSCFFNRGISLLMQDKTPQGMVDVRRAANLSEDPEVRQQAEQLVAELRASGIN